jgi:hypothetical protein
LIAKNITCGVRIHFPAYCFQNSSGTLTLGSNAIYCVAVNGTRVDKFKSGYFNHRTNGEDRQNMADDRMRNDDDLQRNMGGGAKDQDYGQQSPGRTGQEGHGGKQGGQQAGGQGGSQQKSNYGSGQNERDMEDDDLGAGKAGGQGRGQNR